MQKLFSSTRQDWLSNLKGELRGGVVVALGLIAEALAFSLMAGVDPRVGVYTTACLSMTLAICGGRTAMISATSGSTALIMALLVREHGIEYVTATTLLAGVLQIIGGYFHVNRLISFVSQPVIMGFVNALAILIFTSQLPQMENEGWAAYAAIAAGLAIIYLLPRLTTAIPSPVVCIVVLTAFSMYFQPGFQTIADMGRLPVTFPRPTIPSLSSFHSLWLVLPYALGIAVVGLIESLLTSTVVDDLTDTPSDKARECKGQGIGNLVSGFFGGMTGCGIIDQTKINVHFGGRGRLSTFIAGGLMLFMVLVLHRFVAAIPVPALVAVMIFAAITTFNWHSIRTLRTDPPASTAIMLITVAVVLLTNNLAYGVLAGVCINALLFAKQMDRQLHVEAKEDEEHGKLSYLVRGEIFFASTTDFVEQFDFGTRVTDITIDVNNACFRDLTAVSALKRVMDTFGRHKKNITLSGSAHAFEELKRHGKYPPRVYDLMQQYD